MFYTAVKTFIGINIISGTIKKKKKKKSNSVSKEIQPVNPKGNQSWLFIWRTEAEVLWPPNTKSQLIGKDPDDGKDWEQEEKGSTEDELVEWHHQLNGHEYEQSLGDNEGQGSLICCSAWGRRVGHDLGTEQYKKQCYCSHKIVFFFLRKLQLFNKIVTVIRCNGFINFSFFIHVFLGVQHNDLWFVYTAKWSGQ